MLAWYLFDCGRSCTEEFGGFRENHDRFTALDASLLGLSFEGDRVHTVFAASIDLPFPLPIDFNREVVGWFRIAYTPEEPFSGFWGMSRRSVFVLDRQGVIRYAQMTDNPVIAPDIKGVLAAVKALGVQMSSDPHDELARRRSERHRDRRTPDREAADDLTRSAEQDAAVARARESWFLSRVRHVEDDESNAVRSY